MSILKENSKKEIACILKGDYRDIRHLRKIKGYSIKELSEMMFRTESYVTQLENGKINLTIEIYNQILDLFGLEKIVKTKISIDDIQNQIKGKGAMYIKNSNKEIAKQIILNYIEEKKEEWCAEGILACLELVKLMDIKNPTIKIETDEYAVYDGTDCGNYDLIGSKFTLDTDGVIKAILEDVEQLLDGNWSVPTLEGPWVDLYHLTDEA